MGDLPRLSSPFTHTWLKDADEYAALYRQSIDSPGEFWAERAREHVTFFKEWDRVWDGTFKEGDVRWFTNSKLNVAYNCLDRHVKGDHAEKIAILWEGDEPEQVRRITFREATQEVCRLANVLKQYGIRKGDPIAIYMPMVPEAVYAMLACARIGAPHSVVFAGFSADSLRERIVDTGCKAVITADEGLRGRKLIRLKDICDEAIRGCPAVQHVFVHKRTGGRIDFHEPQDVWLNDAMREARPYCPCETMDAEDPLFYLYTSGSTGRPKGLMHTQAGYLVYVALTHKYVFDYRPGDIHACVADIGWITGHSYIVYGPLCNGATTFMFESVPTYPDAGRYWDMVQRHRITTFYTSPTAIRALMKYGTEFVKKYDRSSLRILGTVGEPINPESWKWYFEEVGEKRCALVDTYWQTETGGIILTPIPGITPMKPGSACFPFFGIRLAVMDLEKNIPLEGNNVRGVLCVQQPWPSLCRTVFGNHQRYMNGYMRLVPGSYFTSDGAIRDADGFYWITGRIDDVLNVSGHRIGTAEIESALVTHSACSEAAVVGYPHEIKGEGIFAYCTMKNGWVVSDDLLEELRQSVRTHIGPFATPDFVLAAPSLPKTRSGKIMRRLLRKIAALDTRPDQLGDTTTLADPSVVDLLIDEVHKATQKKKA